MLRANRHFLPGHVWHLTHCCQDRDSHALQKNGLDIRRNESVPFIRPFYSRY